jgi:hypothetical protein
VVLQGVARGPFDDDRRGVARVADNVGRDRPLPPVGRELRRDQQLDGLGLGVDHVGEVHHMKMSSSAV